jgi:hypothetical protein
MLRNRRSSTEWPGSPIVSSNRITENGHRLAEFDAVLGRVFSGLRGIPFELHGVSLASSLLGRFGLTICRSAAIGELDLHMTRIGPPLVGCSGLLASHFEQRRSGAFVSGTITRSAERAA